MSYIRSPWCVITVLAEYRRCRADFKIKSTSCGLKPRNSSMFWASAERIMCPSLLPTHARTGLWVYRVIENGQRKILFLVILDSLRPRNTVRFNRLMLQGPDERIIKGRPLEVDFDHSHQRLQQGADIVRSLKHHDRTMILLPPMSGFLRTFEVEEEQGDVVLLALIRGQAGPVGDFGEEGVGERVGGQGFVGFHETHEAVGAGQLFRGIGGFDNSVGVENVAIAGFESEFEGLVRGFFKH